MPDLNNTYYYYEFTIRGEKKYFGIRFLIDPSIISSLPLLLLYLFLLLLSPNSSKLLHPLNQVAKSAHHGLFSDSDTKRKKERGRRGIYRD